MVKKQDKRPVFKKPPPRREKDHEKFNKKITKVFHQGKRPFNKKHKPAFDYKRSNNDSNNQADQIDNLMDKSKFDFNIDSDIINKLTGKAVSSSKIQSNQVWNYNSVINEEEKLKQERREKEGKKPKQQEIQTMNKSVNKSDEETKEEENYEMDVDKYESELYSKSMTFSDFKLTKYLIKACSDLEYFYPTKVQEKVIPLILKGVDVLVNSETGSGKTACFLLPIIQKIFYSKNTAHQQKALILLPTRELVFQCTSMLAKFLKYLPSVTYISISGGMSIENQFNLLKQKPDIIIATPGRLIDMIYNYKSVNLDNISIFVLDEADKLLELGFKDAILEIIKLMSNTTVSQTLLFSATLNTKIVDLEKTVLKTPVKIKLSHSAILNNLKQSIVRMKFKTNENDNEIFEKRMAYLLFMVKKENKNRCIIFFRTKQECHKAFIIFKKFDITAAEINSNISQTERLQSLNSFQLGEINFLLATDIAARGIDIEKLKYVINFDWPMESSKYIHRIGRTARKGYLGEAITICDDNERNHIKKLAKKEKFNLNLVKVDNGYVKKFYKSLIEIKNEIDNLIEDDNMEMELQEAEREVDKTMNMTIHKKDIFNKPRKSWYLNKKEKFRKNAELKKEYEKLAKSN